MLKGNTLYINAGGLVNGARKTKDGVAFFGKYLKKGEAVINDFELNYDFPSEGPFNFIIYFNKSNK